MSEINNEQNGGMLKGVLKELTQPFIDLFHTSRALFGVNLSYVLEGLTYFGVVGLLAIYFNQYIGLNDIQGIIADKPPEVVHARLLLPPGKGDVQGRVDLACFLIPVKGNRFLEEIILIRFQELPDADGLAYIVGAV